MRKNHGVANTQILNHGAPVRLRTGGLARKIPRRGQARLLIAAPRAVEVDATCRHDHTTSATTTPLDACVRQAQRIPLRNKGVT